MKFFFSPLPRWRLCSLVCGGEATGGGGGDVGGETGEGFGCCGGGAFGLETGATLGAGGVTRADLGATFQVAAM